MKHTLDEPLGLKNKSKPQGLEVKPLKDNGIPSTALSASAHKVPLGRGTTHCLISITVVHLFRTRLASLKKCVVDGDREAS